MIALGLLLSLAGCTPGPESAPEPLPAVSASSVPRQVTVFAIKAIPGGSTVDPQLSPVRAQLRKILPDHGFELILSRSERLEPGQALDCDLGAGRVAETIYEGDEAGRVSLRCSFKDGDSPPFSTRVDAPENQLFFYERTLRDGSRVLIGVGAR